MNLKVQTAVYIASFFVSSAFASTTERTIDYNYCHKSDPKFNECLKKTFQDVIPQLKAGYRKYRIPAIDPFYLPLVEVTKGQGVVSIDLSLQKLNIYGLVSTVVDSVQLDPEKLTGNIKMHFASPVNLIGTYTAKGKVQVLPINGHGYCNITLVNAAIELFNLQGETVEKKGVKYIRIKNVEVRTTKIDRVILRLDNIFPGNKEISDNLNIVLNENWSSLYEDIRPALEKTMVAIIREVGSYLLSKIPQNVVFPA